MWLGSGGCLGRSECRWRPAPSVADHAYWKALPICAANAVQAGSADARPLTSEAVVSWQGGQVRLRGTAEVEDQERDLWDRCFALTVDGHVVISGAILVPHSARVLRFPVLQVPTWRSREQIPEFKLTPAFPADRSTLSLQEWRWRLSHLH